MGKTRDLFKKIRATKGTFHANMSSIKDRNGMDLTEAEDIKKRQQQYTEEPYKKDLHDPDNHNAVITHLEPDILECKVKWALGNITMNKANGGDGIPVELFQILKDDAVKALHSVLQQIWKSPPLPKNSWNVHAKMGSIRDRNGMDLTEAEDIKKRWQEYRDKLYKKDLHDPDNHSGVITNLEPDILECKVKWALGSITTNKASGSYRIPVEVFQILKDDAVNVLHSICQQIWKTQQLPQV